MSVEGKGERIERKKREEKGSEGRGERRGKRGRGECRRKSRERRE